MRRMTVLLAAAGLVACDRNAAEQSAAVSAPSVQPAFDGADFRDEASKLVHGERLTWVLGCRGCHGKDLHGQLWDDNPQEYGVTWSPNLTRSADAMTEAQLRDVITRGKHPRRAQLWSMPSEMFQHLAASDVDAIIAHLKSLPPSGEVSPDPQLGPKARAQIADGTIKPADVLVRELKDVLPADAGGQHQFGRYIATVACTECHGHQLEGNTSEDGSTPDLGIAAAYSREEFRVLTTRGIAKGGRKIHPLMQSVGKNRLSRLTSRERDALYDYLVARLNQPQPAGAN